MGYAQANRAQLFEKCASDRRLNRSFDILTFHCRSVNENRERVICTLRVLTLLLPEVQGAFARVDVSVRKGAIASRSPTYAPC